MRLLVAPGMQTGHVLPFAAAVRTLQRRGHDVFIAGERDITAPLHRARGVRYAGGAEEGFTAKLSEASTRAKRAQVASRYALATARVMAKLFSETHFDAALVDLMNPGAALACEHAGVPFVTFVTAPVLWHPEFSDWPSDVDLRPVRRALGLPAPEGNALEQARSRQRIVLPWIPELQVFKVPRTVRYVGAPYSEAKTKSTPLGRWLEASPRPRVLVSLSTSASKAVTRANARVARMLESVLGAHGWTRAYGRIAHFTRARAARRRDVAFLDHAALLPAANLIVSHGGFGTVTRAMIRGVPQLVIPFERDQPFNGLLVEALGVGEFAAPERVTKAWLEEALRALLARGSSYVKKARAVRARFAEFDGASLIADEVEHLANRSW